MATGWQAALDAGDHAAAAELLRAEVDVERLNDLAVVRHLLGDRDAAEALLRACVVLEPEGEAAENLAALVAEPGAGQAAWRRSPTLGGPEPEMPERAFPGMPWADVMAEHAARYAFAMSLVGGLDVLDLGCGTGYGSEMLSWVAASVRGYDLWSPGAGERPAWPGGAVLSYGHDLDRDPLPPAGAAVMFEVIEHLADAPAALRTALAAAPLLVTSFPNPVWHGSHHNPHHVNDWSLEAFERELRAAAPVGTRLALEHLSQDSGAGLVRGRRPDASYWIVVARVLPDDRATGGDVAGLQPAAVAFQAELNAVKERVAPAQGWYPYGSLSNVWHLDRLLTGEHRDLGRLAAGGPVADIGAADGDMAYFLHRALGLDVEIVDHAPTNWNGLAGARLLGEQLGTPLPIHEVDLDTQFALPRDDYGLVVFLGILYHLQNPFYALRALAGQTRHLLLSTRVARQTADGEVALAHAPLAYLVDPTETNDDPTNYWIFSLPGLRRLATRTGWEVLDEMTVGRVEGDSDPSSPDRDERAFMLLRARTAAA